MNELTKQSRTEITVLGGLAQEAQYYAKCIANGMIQLGRVLTEAKPLVKHGEWEQWIRENAGCSVRYAQVFMQAYARFGNNAAVAQIGEFKGTPFSTSRLAQRSSFCLKTTFQA